MRRFVKFLLPGGALAVVAVAVAQICPVSTAIDTPTDDIGRSARWISSVVIRRRFWATFGRRSRAIPSGWRSADSPLVPEVTPG